MSEQIQQIKIVGGRTVHPVISGSSNSFAEVENSIFDRPAKPKTPEQKAPHAAGSQTFANFCW